MKYIQTNQQNEFIRHLSNAVQYWDENNYCTPEALVKDGRAEQFRVVEMVEVEQPTYNPMTQAVEETDPALIGEIWTQQWQVIELSPEEIQANQKALVPSSITRRQAIQALRIHGITKAMVSDALAAIPDDLQRDLAMIEWEDSQVFERNRQLVESMGAAFGMNEAQLDALFITGGNLP